MNDLMTFALENIADEFRQIDAIYYIDSNVFLSPVLNGDPSTS